MKLNVFCLEIHFIRYVSIYWILFDAFRHLCLSSRNSRWLALANALPSLLARRLLRSQKHGQDPRGNICIVILTQIHMKRVNTLSVLWALASNPFFTVSTSRCGHFAFKAPRVVWSSELEMSHNAVARYRKRLLLCFGRVQCAIASCFLVHKFCIYIA